jgi:hypothetical protein
MPRIAGDSPGYTFRLCRNYDGRVEPTEHGFELRSVTTIINHVIAKPFAAGAWFGFRMGLEGVAQTDMDEVDLDDPAAIEAALKKNGIDPNQTLKKDADRGRTAHDVLEHLAKGNKDFATALMRKEQKEKGTAYGEAVWDWWHAKMAYHPTILRSEFPVWNLRQGYAGTVDLFADGEVVDLKTHKPASGFTKPDAGPAYLSDLLQVRAYRSAMEEMGEEPTGNRIVVARPNGKYVEDEREVSAELWEDVVRMDRLLLERGF